MARRNGAHRRSPVYGYPGGITMNTAGDIIVVGKFGGDAVFAADTLHSAINPLTALPSFDVFIAAWSATSSLQWVSRHGIEGLHGCGYRKWT